MPSISGTSVDKSRYKSDSFVLPSSGDSNEGAPCMSAIDLEKGNPDTKRTSQTLRSMVISCTFIICRKKEEKEKRQRGYLMLGKRLLFDNATGHGLRSNGRTCDPWCTSVPMGSSVFVIVPVQSAIDKINKSSLGTTDGARSLPRAVRLSQGRWKACHSWPFLIYRRSPVELSGRCRRARSQTRAEADMHYFYVATAGLVGQIKG